MKRSLFLSTLLSAVLLVGCPSSDSAPNDPENGDSSANSESSIQDSTSPTAEAKKQTTENSADAEQGETGQPKQIAAKPEPDVNDEQFHADILAAADGYLRYALVDTSVNLAIADCAPASDAYAAPRLSQAEGDAGHAQKLYFLFAKNIAHYFNAQGKPSPVGQAIVKEAWTSKPSNSEARNLRRHASANRVNPRVAVGDKTLEIGKRTNLFVMIKKEAETAGTDEGWVYGIVDSDTNEVLASGAVASCMNCHSEKEDRLFRADLVIVFDEEIIESDEESNNTIGSNQPSGKSKQEAGQDNSKSETER